MVSVSTEACVFHNGIWLQIDCNHLRQKTLLQSQPLHDVGPVAVSYSTPVLVLRFLLLLVALLAFSCSADSQSVGSLFPAVLSLPWPVLDHADYVGACTMAKWSSGDRTVSARNSNVAQLACCATFVYVFSNEKIPLNTSFFVHFD